MKRKEILSSKVWPATALLRGRSTPRIKRKKRLLFSQPSLGMKSTSGRGYRGPGLPKQSSPEKSVPINIVNRLLKQYLPSLSSCILLTFPQSPLFVQISI